MMERTKKIAVAIMMVIIGIPTMIASLVAPAWLLGGGILSYIVGALIAGGVGLFMLKKDLATRREKMVAFSVIAALFISLVMALTFVLFVAAIVFGGYRG